MTTNLNLLQQLTEAQIYQNDDEALTTTEQQQAILESVSGPGEGLDVDMPTLGATPSPYPNCCMIYSEKYYLGSHISICHGGSNTNRSDLWWDHLNFNDKAGSWACGRNTHFTLCDNEAWRCKHVASSSGRINNPDIGGNMENELTSVTVGPYNLRDHGAVTLFDNAGCWGDSAAFEYQHVEGRTEYLHTDLDARGIGQDRASSIMVPFGYVAELYADFNFTGN